MTEAGLAGVVALGTSLLGAARAPSLVETGVAMVAAVVLAAVGTLAYAILGSRR